MTKVILNEQHTLMPNQIQVLNERYTEQGWELYTVPANGWTLEEMEEIAHDLFRCEVVFASPIPALMKFLAFNDIIDQAQTTDGSVTKTFFVLHNDRREKKELPNGKIIMTVAKEGWVIV